MALPPQRNWLARLKQIGATPVPAPPGPRQWAELLERLRAGRNERALPKSTDLQTLEAGLGTALRGNQLRLDYQPRFDTVSGRVTGAEALLRWQHPDLGLLQPAQFIPYAEETGAILPLARWVLRHACAQLTAWDAQGLPPVQMSVNLTAHQLADAQLCIDATQVLDDLSLAHDRLELEVTETVLMLDSVKAVAVLRRLQAAGIRIALDDFGIGYTALAHLEEFPVDIVKIDASMLQNVPGDPADEAMLVAIIDAGRRLKIRVVAKGVETTPQVQFLRQRRCDAMQGFFFSPPVGPELFAERVLRNLTIV